MAEWIGSTISEYWTLGEAATLCRVRARARRQTATPESVRRRKQISLAGIGLATDFTPGAMHREDFLLPEIRIISSRTTGVQSK